MNFFSFNFPLHEFFLVLRPPPPPSPIRFLMVRPLSHYSVGVQHLHDVVRTMLLSHAVVILCSSLMDKILKEQNTNRNKLLFCFDFLA